MFKYLVKEAKSLLRQFSKSSSLVKVCVVFLVLFCTNYIFNKDIMTFNLQQITSLREGLVSNGGKSLVYFHMNGCPFCKKFDGGWDDFVSKNNTKIKTRKVESSEPEAKKMQVGGYPSVILLQGDQKIGEWKDRKVPQSADEQDSVNQQNSQSLLAFCQANQ